MTFYRQSKVCAFRIYANLPKVYTDGEVICELTEEYRPIATSDFQITNTAGAYLGTLRINTNGKVTPVFGSLDTGTVRCMRTYIGK